MSAAPTWDLDALLPGGPGGAAFDARLAATRTALVALVARVQALAPIAQDPAGWATWLLASDDFEAGFDELGSWTGAWRAAYATDPTARAAAAAVDDLEPAFDQASVAVAAALDDAPDDAFEALLARPELAEPSPRSGTSAPGAASACRPRRKPSPSRSSARRSTAGGSSTIWSPAASRRPSSSPGSPRSPSARGNSAPPRRRRPRRASGRVPGGAARVGRPRGALRAHPHPAHRRPTDAPGPARPRRAAVTLHRNRVSQATLDAILGACTAAQPALLRYFAAKARLFGKDRLDWWDVEAPLPAPAYSDVPWGRAEQLVTDAFDRFNPDLAEFSRRAFRERWIEAEPRAGKAAGGFCTKLPVSRQSRIFMTYAGTLDNAMTLAHELGHAYHNELLFRARTRRRHITSATAETASTFAEALVLDQLSATAPDAATVAYLLDQQLSAAVAFLMNIPARFQFERRLFALRRQGMLTANGLSAEMVACQRASYADGLASWDPTFWASKLHFYIARASFYNWPYSFGYLFSSALYQRAREEGPAFLPVVADVLVRAGWDDAEGVGRACLGVDLTQPELWLAGVRLVERRVDQFIRACDTL